MLFSDPKWGSGCIAIIAVVGGLTLLSAAMQHFGWTLSLPQSVGGFVSFLVFLAIARFVVNQIFD